MMRFTDALTLTLSQREKKIHSDLPGTLVVFSLREFVIDW